MSRLNFFPLGRSLLFTEGRGLSAGQRLLGSLGPQSNTSWATFNPPGTLACLDFRLRPPSGLVCRNHGLVPSGKCGSGSGLRDDSVALCSSGRDAGLVLCPARPGGVGRGLRAACDGFGGVRWCGGLKASCTSKQVRCDCVPVAEVIGLCYLFPIVISSVPAFSSDEIVPVSVFSRFLQSSKYSRMLYKSAWMVWKTSSINFSVKTKLNPLFSFICRNTILCEDSNILWDTC